MAHTIMKRIYDSERKKYLTCEILVLDEEEKIPPGTDRREILLSCNDEGDYRFEAADDEDATDIGELYPETELIDQYEDFDNRS